VGQELKKMTAFIRQEAIEKAREIEIQANEDFAKEKSKLVREEQATIDAQYEKKFKSASMSQQITRSTVANKTRLRVLQARQELLDEIFETASSKLKDATEDAKKYQDLVKNLILEGAYALNEPKISVRVRKVDVEVAQKAIPDVEKEYKEGVNKDLKVEIDEKNPVEEES
jgi:V-type H+-transporting ATPase subunit E